MSTSKMWKKLLSYKRNRLLQVPIELIVPMILNSLPSQYNLFVKMLTSKDFMSTLEELESWLLNEEMEIKTNSEKEIS